MPRIQNLLPPRASLSSIRWPSNLAGSPACCSSPQEPFFLWKPDLMPSSSAPPGLASWGAPNSHLTYLRPGPSLWPLLGLIHFSLSPRPARWISPIFHPSHLGPCQGRAVSSRLFNMCEAICQNSAPIPAREEASSVVRQRQPLSPGPAGVE